jgi:hypothetical protein
VTAARSLATFAQDHARIFECIAEQADDADERSVQREIHAGLRHGCALRRCRFRVMAGSVAQKFRAKIFSGSASEGVSGIMKESWLPGMAKIGAG